MPASLDPIDEDGSAFRVSFNGKRMGIVTLNSRMGVPVWQHATSGREDSLKGAFNLKEEAADQLVVNYLQRQWEKKQKPKRKDR